MLSGIFVTSKTTMPLIKRSVVNCRWGVNFTSDSDGQVSMMSRPMLMLNKIGIERVEEVKEVGVVEKKSNGGSADLELLKGMRAWMGREMEELQRQNREIMQAFEAVRSRASTLRNRREEREFTRKRGISTLSAGHSDFERWRSQRAVLKRKGREIRRNQRE